MVGSCPRLMLARPCIVAASHIPHPPAVRNSPCPSLISISETCLCLSCHPSSDLCCGIASSKPGWPVGQSAHLVQVWQGSVQEGP